MNTFQKTVLTLGVVTSAGFAVPAFAHDWDDGYRYGYARDAVVFRSAPGYYFAPQVVYAPAPQPVYVAPRVIYGPPPVVYAPPPPVYAEYPVQYSAPPMVYTPPVYAPPAAFYSEPAPYYPAPAYDSPAPNQGARSVAGAIAGAVIGSRFGKGRRASSRCGTRCGCRRRVRPALPIGKAESPNREGEIWQAFP